MAELPKSRQTINNKWIFVVKRNPDGLIERYKARLVIKGCNQKSGIDYYDTFSPIARLETIRLILSITAKHNMKLKHFDVASAFLNGHLEEEIFMKQPVGFEDGTNRVLKLKKCLYGLKQASRCWNRKFNQFMVSQGFSISNEDPCVYFKIDGEEKIIIALYIADGLVTATTDEAMRKFIEALEGNFKIVVKEATFYLGCEIHQGDGFITINQVAFIKKLLEKYGMESCNLVATPMEHLRMEMGEKKETTFPYRSCVGALLYLAVGTRPDLAFSIGVLSRSLEHPTEADVGRLKRVLRYLSGTVNLSLVY